MTNLPEFEPDLEFTADVLQALYNDFLWETNLPQMSAEDLILSDITAEQRTWLSTFITLWEDMERKSNQ